MLKSLCMNAVWDILRELLNPVIQLLVKYIYVIVVVIPQATWDMSDEKNKAESRKQPISQSAAIVLMNISSSPVEISDAGIRFKDGKELILSDFDLPVKIEGHNRHEFVLNPNTFEMLKGIGLGNIGYFYLEDRLLHRFKARLSKKDIEKLLTTYYLVKSA